MVRQAKDGFTACLNRDVHRSDRLPAMAALNTFLGWDEIQGCSLHPRLYPIPPAISPAHRRDGCTRHVHTYGWSEISKNSVVARHRPGVYTGTARSRAAMALDHGCSRHVMQDLHQWQDASTWQIRPNPPNLFPPGTWKQTAHQPAIMLTARLWTLTGVACTDTTFFYNSLERKGNDRGHFVSEPISTVSLTESTGSWEAPPPPLMAPTASPPGPAQDLHPVKGIWADPPADSGDHLHASASAGDTAPEAGVHPAAVAATASGHELCGADGWNHSNSSFAAQHPGCCDGSGAR